MERVIPSLFMKNRLKSLETYLVQKVQTPDFHSNKNNPPIRQSFSIIKLELHHYLRFDEKGKKLACYAMEVLLRQLKRLIGLGNDAPFDKDVNCMTSILDAFLDVAGHRTREFIESGNRFRHAKLDNDSITLNGEKMLERYKNDLIFSAFTIRQFLSVDWPSEVKSECFHIDKFLDAKKNMASIKISESLVAHSSLEERLRV